MENAKKTRFWRWAVGILLAGLALFVVWYHIPIHRTLEVTAYETDYDVIGAPAALQMDITLHRSLSGERWCGGGWSWMACPMCPHAG